MKGKSNKSGIKNFFSKKKDRLDYTRTIFCPIAQKHYIPEIGSNVCPACGEIIPDRNDRKTFLVQTPDDHRMSFTEVDT